MRYYIIAGERSGDLHGSNLVKAIKKLDLAAEFRGIGGEYMKDAGVNLTIDYGDMAFMGFVEVFMNLRTISRFVKLARHDIREYNPDVVILIDYAGFNRQMASFCKKHNIKVFYYISPKVWAWHQRRALHLKRNVDQMFVILPFETDFYKKYDWKVHYVGNPVLDAIKSFQPDADFRSRYNFQTSKPLVALLPGSRRQELERMLPLMGEVAKRYPDYQFAVATVSNLDQALYDPVKGMNNITFVSEDTYNLLHNADAAIVTSGTATLETGLFKVPQIVVYKTGGFGYAIAKWVVSVEFISLVNLIANKEVVRELIQDNANPEAVGNELGRLISDKPYRQQMIANYDSIYKTLDIGSASENTARLMLQYLTISSS